MGINIGSTVIDTVKRGTTQIAKVYLGIKTIWENWVLMYTTLDSQTSDWESNNVNETGNMSISHYFGKTVKIQKCQITGGTRAGAFYIAGIRADGSVRNLASVSGEPVYAYSNPQTSYFTGAEGDDDLEFVGVKYYSVAPGHYRILFTDGRITQWYQKGA